MSSVHCVLCPLFSGHYEVSQIIQSCGGRTEYRLEEVAFLTNRREACIGSWKNIGFTNMDNWIFYFAFSLFTDVSFSCHLIFIYVHIFLTIHSFFNETDTKF